MKGTAQRGRTEADDAAARDALHTSVKQRAENVMIVDMVRNDFGRIADLGSVEVPALFAVERYPSVWQMTSTVTARSGASLSDVFAALFPPASVTGAPKRRTMEIIRAIEGGPRGVHTGAIGHVDPESTARFSVAIRTAIVDRQAASVTFGIGSGIVWDSVAADEYAECLLKGAIIGQPEPAFDLLETLSWRPADGFFLLDRHLNRLRESACYFGRPFIEGEARAALNRATQGCTEPCRVRLLLSRDGGMRAEAGSLPERPRLQRVRLAEKPVDARDLFLFHKTTNRGVYERALLPDGDDTILWNEQGFVTESTPANVVVEREGMRVTPPVECGLLAGTFRAELLEAGEVHEAVITTDELREAERVWLINSVNRWMAARVAN